MNNTIKTLLKNMEECRISRAELERKLQIEWNKIFDNTTSIQKALINAENASEYQCNEYGKIESWYRFSGLSDFEDCQELLETYINECGFPDCYVHVFCERKGA